MIKLRYYPHITLLQKSEDIANIDSDIVKLSESMIELMKLYGGIGLAANQVNCLKRLIVIDEEFFSENCGLSINSVLINPEIINSDGSVDSTEGCLSFPKLSFIVQRPKNVIVKALSLDEKEIIIQADNLLAACLVHEIEHLDGITLIDKVSKTQKKIYLDKLKSAKRLNV